MRNGWRLGIAAVACVVLTTNAAPRAHAGNQTECEKKAAQRVSHDCVSCDASVSCLERVTAAGGAAEIIPIGHGLMVIYNTPLARKVPEVQNAALERWDVMDKIIAGKADGHLCASCCAARTLLMRADRQVYRTSTGVVCMISSDDFTVVNELHRMVPKRRVVTPDP
jgi:hypothetical protein